MTIYFGAMRFLHHLSYQEVLICNISPKYSQYFAIFSTLLLPIFELFHTQSKSMLKMSRNITDFLAKYSTICSRENLVGPKFSIYRRCLVDLSTIFQYFTHFSDFFAPLKFLRHKVMGSNEKQQSNPSPSLTHS